MDELRVFDQINLVSENSSDPTSEVLRKDQYESKLSTSKLNDHVYSDDIHVSNEERNRWNAKIDKITNRVTPVTTESILKLSFNSDGLITKSTPATIDDFPPIPIDKITGLQAELDKSFTLPDTAKNIHYLKDQKLLTDYVDELKLRLTSSYFSKSLTSNAMYTVFFYDETYDGEESPIALVPSNGFELNDRALVFWHKNPQVVYVGTYNETNTWTWITEPTSNMFVNGFRIAYRQLLTATTTVADNLDVSEITGYATYKLVDDIPTFEITPTLNQTFTRDYKLGVNVVSETEDGFVNKDIIKAIDEKETTLDATSAGIGALPAHDFGTRTPTQEELNSYVDTIGGVTSKTGMYVRNLFEGCNDQWVYNKDGIWVNTGSSIINYATDNTLGIGKLGTESNQFTMDMEENSLTKYGVKLNAYDTLANKMASKMKKPTDEIEVGQMVTLDVDGNIINSGIKSSELFATLENPDTHANKYAMYDENGMIVDSGVASADFTVENNISFGFFNLPESETIIPSDLEPIFETLIPRDGNIVGIPLYYQPSTERKLFGLINVYYSMDNERYELFGTMVNADNPSWSDSYFVRLVDTDDRMYMLPYTVYSYNGEYAYNPDTQEINTFIPDHYLKIQLWNNKIIYCETVEDLNLCCAETETWERITFSNGDSFLKNDVKSVKFGNLWNLEKIPDNFMYHFANLRSIGTIPTSVTEIGNAFLSGCSKFNSSIMMTQNTTIIGDSFLFGCSEFNQNLVIPNNVTKINANFMNNCAAFNSNITIPSPVTAIGNSFMVNCGSFNHKLVIPDNVATIGINFMDGCYMFNQNLEIPDSISTIGENFMPDCRSMTSITVTPKFIEMMRANSSIETDTSLTVDINSCAQYRSGLKIIGLNGANLNTFMALFPNITTAGKKAYRRIVTNTPLMSLYNNNGFVHYVANENDMITISNSSASTSEVQLSDGISFKKNRIYKVEFNPAWNGSSLPNYFLRNFDALRTIDNKTDDVASKNFPSSITSIGDYFLAGCKVYNQPEFSLPPYLTAIKDYFMSGCTSFNQPLTIPSSVTTIGDYFMNACQLFAASLTLPNTLTKIGEYFVTGCNAIAEITIPASVTDIGIAFCANCRRLIKLITAPSILNALKDDMWTLGTTSKSYVMYIVGVTFNTSFSESEASALHAKLPDRSDTAPFRKILTL